MRFGITAVGCLVMSGLAAGQISPARAQSGSLPPNTYSTLGTDLTAVRDWSTEYTFVDAFKASRGWMTQCDPFDPAQPRCTVASSWDTREESQLDLDPNGWMRSLPDPASSAVYRSAGTVLLRNVTRYPAGQYIVLYDGQGTIGYGLDATRDAAVSTPGRDVVNVVPSPDGFWMAITATDPARVGNYIRNIRVIMPGFESTYQTQVFHPTLLRKLERYHVLRFMNWMDTDASTQGTWANRPKMTDARWSIGKGVPVEQMVQLANTVNADPWFNIPHLATDDYVTQFASTVLAQLSTSRNVYIEYSNEVWNQILPYSVAGDWAQAQGNAMWPDPTIPAYDKRLNFIGMRSAQICDIFNRVFAGQNARVICVMAAQSAYDWTGIQELDCPLWTQGAPCYQHGIRALAGAPYIFIDTDDPMNRAELRNWTADPDGGLNRLFTEINSGGMLTRGYPGGELAFSFAQMDMMRALASARGLGVVAYEGGQALFDYQADPLIVAMFKNANRDPRMGAVYNRYFDGWAARGLGTFIHENNCQAYGNDGYWGALEYIEQPTSPKYGALMRQAGRLQLSPSNTIAGGSGSLTLTVNGTDFAPGTQVAFNGTNVQTTYVSNVQLTAMIPPSARGATGVFSVTLLNPAPLPTNNAPGSFTVNNPAAVLSAISPSGGYAYGPAFTMTVTGSSFVPGATISFNGTKMDTVYVSGTQLTATIPSAALLATGSFQVSASNPTPTVGSSGSMTFTVTNPAPSIATLSPSSATAGDPMLTVTIDGTGFIPSSQVIYSSYNLATTFVSTTRLFVVIPAASVSVAGTYNVTVVNGAPGGGTSPAATFTVNNPLPVLSAISPSTAVVGQSAFTMTITGSSFVNTSQVSFNGVNAGGVTVSSTQINLFVDTYWMNLAQGYTVTVVNPGPGGGTSAGQVLQINNPVPTVVSVSPNAIPALSGDTYVMINGAGLQPSSQVLWDGTLQGGALQVSSSQISFKVADAWSQTPGTHTIQVFTPAPGGGTSGALMFTVY